MLIKIPTPGPYPQRFWFSPSNLGWSGIIWISNKLLSVADSSITGIQGRLFPLCLGEGRSILLPPPPPGAWFLLLKTAHWWNGQLFSALRCVVWVVPPWSIVYYLPNLWGCGKGRRPYGFQGVLTHPILVVRGKHSNTKKALRCSNPLQNVTLLSIFHPLSHLVCTRSLYKKYFYPQLTNKEAKTQSS